MRKLILASAIGVLAACGPDEAETYDEIDEGGTTPGAATGTVDPAGTTTAPAAGTYGPAASIDTAGMSGTQQATGTDADGPGQVP